MEPWLWPRLRHEGITIRPKTRMPRSEAKAEALRVCLDTGDTVEVDHILYATGYKINLLRLVCKKSYRVRGAPSPAVYVIYKVADFQKIDSLLYRDSSLRSLPAARDFGLFFAFTAAVPSLGSASLVVQSSGAIANSIFRFSRDVSPKAIDHLPRV